MVSNKIKRTVNLAADYSRLVSSVIIGASPFIAGSENFSKILAGGLIAYFTSYAAQIATGRVVLDGADDFSARNNYEVHTTGRDAVTAITSFFVADPIVNQGLEVMKDAANILYLSPILLTIGASEFFAKRNLRNLEAELASHQTQ